MTTEKIKITMSERRPMSIVAADWPIVARVDRHDGAVESQANHVWTIRVRQHADGRRIVYGWLNGGHGGSHWDFRPAYGGYLLPSDDGAPDDTETVRAIRRIGGIIDDSKLAAECIADLPAQDVT